MSTFISYMLVMCSLFMLMIASIIGFSGNTSVGGKILLTSVILACLSFVIEIVFGKD